MDAKMIEIKSMGIKNRDYVVLGINNKPINPELPLWQQTGKRDTEEPTLRPVAFLLNQPQPAALLVTVRILSLHIDEDFFLEGLYGTNNLRLFYGLPIEKNKENKEVVFRVHSLYTPEGFFKMTGKGLFWRISRSGTGEFKELGSVDLEIYWLYGDPYDYFPKGIPLETLREIARVCQFNRRIKHNQFDHEKQAIKLNGLPPGIPAKQWVVQQVVNHCFTRNPPRFDTWRGCSRFTISGSQYAKTLLINQYLNSKNDSNALCNCTDQAGVLQYFLKVIGIDEVMVYPLDRFGYLKEIQLVGRGTCNNPYYGTAKGCAREQAVVGNCKEQTFFENHFFCVLKINGEWRVLDSCIGPYTGEDNKDQYLKKAREEDKWPKNDRTKVASPDHIILPGEPVPKSPKGVPRSITFTINQLPEQEVTMQPKSALMGAPRFLVRKWPDIARLRIPDKKGWKLLFKEIIPGKTRVLKTWKLVKGKSTITIHLYISHIDPRPQPLNQPGEWMSWQPQAKSKGTTDTPGETTKMAGEFHQEKNHNFKIHAYFQDIASQDEPFIDQLKARLKQLVTGENDGIDQLVTSRGGIRDIKPEHDLPAISSITCSNKSPQKGERITVTIPVEPDVYYDFYIEGKGLKHIDDYESKNEKGRVKCLDFVSRQADEKKSGNQLVILAVHKKKLMLNSQTFDIKVTS